MNHPLVVHHRKQPFDICVGRPGPFGNPVEIGRDGTRADDWNP
jgi:hypothetical protein